MPDYEVIASATKYVPFCILTVKDKDGKTDYIAVKEWVKDNGLPLVGKKVHIETTNREIIPSDIQIPVEYPDEPQVG
jgi:hypothetical protein